MRSLATLTTMIVLVILCGCGASVPTEHDGRQSISEQLSSESSSKVKLFSFQKTNGKGNDQNYTIEFEAVVEITEDGWWDGHTFYKSKRDFPAGFNYGLPTPVKAGEQRKIKGEACFEKTEKGWKSTVAGWWPPEINR